MSNGKKILITGGTSGIGEAALHLCAAQGYEVHFTTRKLSKTSEALCQKYPGKVFAHALDQGRPEEIAQADFLTAHSWYGVIFNAALGSGTVKTYVTEEDPLGFIKDEAMLRVNALGPLFIYKRIAPVIEKRTEKTKLIFVSSVGGGIAAFPHLLLSDGMSKIAILQLSKQLAAENAHTLVDVFCICPGATETAMLNASTLSKMDAAHRADFERKMPKGRLIQAPEIAYWLEQLLREESTVLHGTNLDASLGLGARPGLQTEQQH